MKMSLLCVGQRMPDWVERGCQEYLKRFSAEFRVELREIAPARRVKNQNPARYREEEGARLLAAIPDQALVIALEVGGQAWSTETLAEKFMVWQGESVQPVFVVGGPDGLSADVLKRARIRWSLSPLTFPHPFVRIILLEQFYRAWTINKGHPYHRSE